MERLRMHDPEALANERLTKLINWVKETSKPVAGLLVPVSGGTDSALTFWLCAQARPGKVLGVNTPDIRVNQLLEKQSGDLRAKEWFDSQAAEIKMVNTPGEFREREEMRWAHFLAMSIQNDFALVGSRTRTEHNLGTYSLASRVATIYPLLGVWKSDVIELCKVVGVPDEIIASSSQPDCDCGRPERLSQIPFSQVDAFLKKRLGEEVDLSGLAPDHLEYLEGLVNYTYFKKDLPFAGPVV